MMMIGTDSWHLTFSPFCSRTFCWAASRAIAASSPHCLPCSVMRWWWYVHPVISVISVGTAWSLIRIVIGCRRRCTGVDRSKCAGVVEHRSIEHHLVMFRWHMSAAFVGVITTIAASSTLSPTCCMFVLTWLDNCLYLDGGYLMGSRRRYQHQCGGIEGIPDDGCRYIGLLRVCWQCSSRCDEIIDDQVSVQRSTFSLVLLLSAVAIRTGRRRFFSLCVWSVWILANDVLIMCTSAAHFWLVLWSACLFIGFLYGGFRKWKH